MKRWGVAAAALVALSAALAAFFLPRSAEEFPLAGLVPADALFYGGFPDARSLEDLASKLPADWTADLLSGLEEARPRLAGGVAVYLDRELEWVLLARLTRTAAALSRGVVEDGAAVFARSPGALARHRARKGALADLESFRALGSRLFVNLAPLRLPGRLGDFRAIGLEVAGADPWVVRGRAAYRAGLFRLYLEEYANLPGRGAPQGGGPVAAALAESFVRLWDDLLRDLPPSDREHAEREAAALGRDCLGGRTLREFLRRVGPSCGITVLPAPSGDLPSLVAWVDLADDGARETLGAMLERAVQDAGRYARDRGRPPALELEAGRVRFPWAEALALDDAFTPAYAFQGNRLVFSTRAAALQAPPVAAGDAHGTISIEVGPALELARALAPLLADRAFRDESGRSLRDLRRTPRYAEELARRKERIEGWAKALGWLERVTWTGRYTADGLAFELRAERRRQP